jgi:hypothetical protein
MVVSHSTQLACRAQHTANNMQPVVCSAKCNTGNCHVLILLSVCYVLQHMHVTTTSSMVNINLQWYIWQDLTQASR